MHPPASHAHVAHLNPTALAESARCRAQVLAPPPGARTRRPALVQPTAGHAPAPRAAGQTEHACWAGWAAGAKAPPQPEGWQARRFNTGELMLYLAHNTWTGQRPALLLLPGQLDPWHDYLPSLPALGAHFDVVVIELRGHGLSERAPGDAYRVIDYARDAAAVIEHVIGRPAIVSGNSLGGMAALALAQHWPERVAGLFLEDPPLFVVDEPAVFEGALMLADFAPALLAMRAVQHEGATTVQAALARARMPAMLPFGFPTRPLSDDAAWRARCVQAIVEGPRKAVYAALPAREQARLLGALQAYVDRGEVPRKCDITPMALLGLEDAHWLLADWQAPQTMFDGRWLEDFDPLEALRTLKVPTVYWEADPDLAPLHTAEHHAATCAALQQSGCRHAVIQAMGCPHIAHLETPAPYTDALIRFFVAG